MRTKNRETMERIIEFANSYQREYGRSPSTTEIAREVGVARGTAYTYLVSMRELGMIEYDGQNIGTFLSEKVDHSNSNVPILGRVACGDAVSEEEEAECFVDLPSYIFGDGEKFILEAYGDSMDEAGIEAGDYVVVRRQRRASDGDLVIALTNGENNLKRIRFDRERKEILLCPESTNPYHRTKRYKEVTIQGVVTHIIKKAR